MSKKAVSNCDLVGYLRGGVIEWDISNVDNWGDLSDSEKVEMIKDKGKIICTDYSIEDWDVWDTEITYCWDAEKTHGED